MPTTTAPLATTTTFPATVLQELQPREAGTYDKRTGMYCIQRRFQLLGLEWAHALSIYGPSLEGVPVPETFDQVYTEDGSTPVEMIAVTRHADKMAQRPNGLHECILTVTYEGHACMQPQSGYGVNSTTTAPNGAWFNGVVSGHFEFGTKSEHILVSFDRDANGNRIPIGSPGDAEGTNRLVPNCRMVIVQNMTAGDYYARVPMIASLIGLLNENLWQDPLAAVCGDNPYSWYEGMWLSLGAQVSQNRDGTVTVQHQFEFDARPKPFDVTSTTAGNAPKLFGATFYFHKFLYYRKAPKVVAYTDANGVTRNKIVNVPTEPPVYATIYETAGPGVSLGYRFADLFLPVEVLA